MRHRPSIIVLHGIQGVARVGDGRRARGRNSAAVAAAAADAVVVAPATVLHGPLYVLSSLYSILQGVPK